MYRRIILLSVTAILIAGCQNTQSIIGSGPITLSSKITNFYKEKYLKGAPVMFVVSKNGQAANFSYCPDGPGGCSGIYPSRELSEKCKAVGHGECYIFDQNGFIVWDGPVNFSSTTSRPTKSSVKYRSKKNICRLATRVSDNIRVWDYGSTASKDMVIGAKYFNLTPSDCGKLLGDKIAAPKVTKDTDSLQNTEIEQSLETIKRLLERDLISEEEAKQKRIDLLNKIK